MMAPMSIGLLLTLSITLQDPPEQAKIDEAIKKGCDWLLKKQEKGFDGAPWNSTLELVMLTLRHGNIPVDNDIFKKGLESMLSTKLRHTYRVGLHAMALQSIDAAQHRERISHCAQWLVDTQCSDGEWGYPGVLQELNQIPSSMEVDPPKIEPGKGKSEGTMATIKIRRRKPAKPKDKGDISNAQFALLGLRASVDAGIEIPPETWGGALKYYTKIQRQDGGWGYFIGDTKDKSSYGSMTCAGICAVAICTFSLGNKNVLKHGSVQAGLNWMAKNWSVSENPMIKKSHVADTDAWHYYYLYSIERVGKIVAVDKVGSHNWYAEGARWLLGKQKTDGSWTTGVTPEWQQAGDLETADTCFAILFLTKATPPLVPTESGKKK